MEVQRESVFRSIRLALYVQSIWFVGRTLHTLEEPDTIKAHEGLGYILPPAWLSSRCRAQFKVSGLGHMEMASMPSLLRIVQPLHSKLCPTSPSTQICPSQISGSQSKAS